MINIDLFLVFFLLGTIYDMDRSNTKCNYKGRDSQSLVKMFTYRQPFGFHL